MVAELEPRVRWVVRVWLYLLCLLLRVERRWGRREV